MFEFLLNNSNTENPTLISVLVTVLSAFFLSSLIVMTYEVTTRNVVRPVNFLQSMALIAIVAATIMQAIGDSLARGIGMLGALAIIRFRTKLDNPRNITFMFSAIASGIACGVFGFITAFMGTIAFCVAAIILKFSPLSNDNVLTGNLRIRIPIVGKQETEVLVILKKFCQSFELQQLRLLDVKINPETNKEPTAQSAGAVDKESEDTEEKEIENFELIKYKELVYAFSLKQQKDLADLSGAIEKIPDIQAVRFRFEKQRTIL